MIYSITKKDFIYEVLNEYGSCNIDFITDEYMKRYPADVKKKMNRYSGKELPSNIIKKKLSYYFDITLSVMVNENTIKKSIDGNYKLLTDNPYRDFNKITIPPKAVKEFHPTPDEGEVDIKKEKNNMEETNKKHEDKNYDFDTIVWLIEEICDSVRTIDRKELYKIVMKSLMNR